MGMRNSRTASSQTAKIASVPTSGISAPCAGSRQTLCGSGGASPAAGAEDEVADALGAVLELTRRLLLERARPRQRHVDDLGDPAVPRAHDDHAVAEQH